MKGVILAAGMGSRLRPITDAKPKCMVRAAGRPILDHQIRAYAAAGVKDIVIVVGYKSELVRQYCQTLSDLRVTLVENTEHETTDNMYSLFLARAHLEGQPFVLTNGDVVFDPTILRDVLSDPREGLMAVERGEYNPESMKVLVSGDNRIIDISKEIPPEEAYGSSMDMYKFAAASGRTFFEGITRIVEGEANRGDWTEVALQRLLKRGTLQMEPFDIGPRAWIEVDTCEDLLLADRTFSAMGPRPFRPELIFVDLDGTVYIGDSPVEGAKRFVAALQEGEIPFYFLSNNSSRSKAQYVAKLASLGIAAREDNIILSTDGLVEYLRSRGSREVFLIGTEALRSVLDRAGIRTSSSTPEFVVLGYDTELTYEKLRLGARHLCRGVPLLATHADIVCPTPEGPIPDIGSMLALLEKATGVHPAKVFGKPNPEMVQHVLAARGADPARVVLVGDRLYTDMAMAQSVGCRFVLVLSGDTRREDVERSEKFPDLVLENLGQFADVLEKALPGDQGGQP